MREVENSFSKREAGVGFMCAPSFFWLRELENPPIELLPAAPVFRDGRASGRSVYFSEVIVYRGARPLLFCETIPRMKYERIRYHAHARKRMRRRKISRAQVERTLQNPEYTYASWDKLVAEGVTGAGNTVFVYYVEPVEGEALVISVKRRRPGRRE